MSAVDEKLAMQRGGVGQLTPRFKVSSITSFGIGGIAYQFLLDYFDLRN